MRSILDSKCDKRRGLIFEEIGKESIVHKNGTLVPLFDNLGEQSLDSLFKGGLWYFVTRARAFDFSVNVLMHVQKIVKKIRTCNTAFKRLADRQEKSHM